MFQLIRFIILFLVLLIFGGYTKTYGQDSQSIVSGHIMGEDKNNLPYASISLLNSNDSSLVKSTITDSIGVFRFTKVTKGNYLLYGSYLGYNKYIVPVYVNRNDLSIDSIFLQKSNKILEEVNIYAKKKTIEKTPEGFIFNVENSIIASNGTAIDALSKAPGVFVNQQNGISLKGKTDVLVMIDGRSLNLSGEEEINYLKNINAENISKIKIITNPSSKYDAEGSGIIDIITKKRKNYGVIGTLKYDYALGEYSTHKPGFDINYKNGFINLYGNYTYGYGKTLKEETEDILFSDNNISSIYHQVNTAEKKEKSNIYNAGADISLNSNNILSLMANGFQYNKNINDLTNTLIFENPAIQNNKIITTNCITEKTKNSMYSLNYKCTIDTSGKEITAEADYNSYRSPEDQHITNDFFNNKEYLYSLDPSYGNSIQDVTIETVKTDFIYPLDTVFKFEIGGKLSSINMDNDISFFNITNGVYVNDTNISNRFKYKENIQAFYGNFNYTKTKFNLQAGLRYENTQSNGNSLTLNSNIKSNYYKLFPSLFFEYNINDNHQLDLAYSSRIERPGYWELNPFRWYINPYCYAEGNPWLLSAYVNSTEFSYTFRQKHTFTLFYERTTTPFTQIPEQDNTKNTIRFIEVNLKERIYYGASVSSTLNPFNWWESSNSLNIFEQNEKSEFLNNSINYRILAFDFQTTNNIILLKEQKLSVEISSYYTSPTFQGLFKIGDSFDLSFGFKKYLLKNKVIISILLSDIFNTNSPSARVNYLDQNSSYKFKLDTRLIRINLSYKFGNVTLVPNRNHNTGNEDELKRLENKNK